MFKMSELKTLKDIEEKTREELFNNALEHSPAYISGALKLSLNLRQEAIKWVKEYIVA